MAINHNHNVKEKAKARKSGPSVSQKTKDLGVVANIFAATIYWDPTHLCYRVAAHLPEGQTAPNVNRLIADALTGLDSQQPRRNSRRLAQHNRHRGRKQTLSRRPRSPRQSPINTAADPYAFPETSPDEALSDTSSGSGDFPEHGRGVSSLVDVVDRAERRDLENVTGHITKEISAPILNSTQPAELCQSHDPNERQLESRTRDDSWAEFETSFLDDMLTDDDAAERRVATEAKSSGPPRQTAVLARSVPGTAWRRLAGELLALMDSFASRKTGKAPA
ncbi:hypothetical protein RJ55_08696 [Drechmeria coniospora]|nr:hypothetical protein RJ55_08696 [Drechmeria coniospora]